VAVCTVHVEPDSLSIVARVARRPVAEWPAGAAGALGATDGGLDVAAPATWVDPPEATRAPTATASDTTATAQAITLTQLRRSKPGGCRFGSGIGSQGAGGSHSGPEDSGADTDIGGPADRGGSADEDGAGEGGPDDGGLGAGSAGSLIPPRIAPRDLVQTNELSASCTDRERFAWHQMGCVVDDATASVRYCDLEAPVFGDYSPANPGVSEFNYALLDVGRCHAPQLAINLLVYKCAIA
jgi:hypothetical protein